MSNVLKTRVSISKTTYKTTTGTVSKAGNFAPKETYIATLDSEEQSEGFKEHDLRPAPGRVSVLVLTAPDAGMVDKVFAIPEGSSVKNMYKDLVTEASTRKDEGEEGDVGEERAPESVHNVSDGSVEYSDEYPEGRPTEEEASNANAAPYLIWDPETGSMVRNPAFRNEAEDDADDAADEVPRLIYDPKVDDWVRNPDYKPQNQDGR